MLDFIILVVSWVVGLLFALSMFTLALLPFMLLGGRSKASHDAEELKRTLIRTQWEYDRLWKRDKK